METKVKLSAESIGVKDELFNLSHAERLLQHQDLKGLTDWQLTDKEFMYTNGIIIRTGTGTDKESGSTEYPAKSGKT